MAGICSTVGPSSYPAVNHRRVNGFHCCCSNYNEKKKVTPKFLKVTVAALTELLRFFSVKDRLDTENYVRRNEFPVLSIDDVLSNLKSDYENAYFVTGHFTSAIYSEDCLFEDPTIKFRGTELYARNLKLLVPFFDHPSIALQKIEKRTDGGRNFILATWKLRTYLRLPWRPLISVDGSTVYDLNDNFMIVRHAESWDISALQAIAQIFTPSNGRSGG